MISRTLLNILILRFNGDFFGPQFWYGTDRLSNRPIHTRGFPGIKLLKAKKIVIFGQEYFRSVVFVNYLTEVRIFLKLRFNLRVNSEVVTLQPLYKFFLKISAKQSHF